MLPHGLPGQEDWYQVLPPDRVSAAPPTETGVANKSESCQERRASTAAVPRRGQQGRPEYPRGKPGQVSGGRSCGHGTPPQRRADMWCFPTVGED